MGPAGPAGADGADGSPGFVGVYDVAAGPIAIAPNESHSVTIACNSPENVITGAGYQPQGRPGHGCSAATAQQHPWDVIMHTEPQGFATTAKLHGRCLDVTP